MSTSSLDHEKEFNVDAQDGKKIFCRLNYAGEQQSKKAIILAHGLTGHLNEYIHMAARDYFNERGYDVYRISFYCDGDDHRNLQDTTLQVHADDLNTLTAHLKENLNYKNIYICGHSYGGCTMLFANPNVTAITFWDSTFYPWAEAWEKRSNNIIPLNDNDFLEGNGMTFVFGDAMLQEAKDSTPETMKQKAQKISSPSLVAIAENGDFITEQRKELFDTLTCEKDYTLIPGADHCFTNGHTAQDLFSKTHQWFDKF